MVTVITVTCFEKQQAAPAKECDDDIMTTSSLLSSHIVIEGRQNFLPQRSEADQLLKGLFPTTLPYHYHYPPAVGSGPR